MNAIDTNVLVRLLTRDDATQTAQAETFIAKGAWVSHLVLMETMWVLDSVYGVEKEGIDTAVTMLLDHAQLAIQDTDVVRNALNDFKNHNAVDFSDCLIVATARKAGHTPLGTFDRALSRINDTERL